jgi:hypothetical protein
MNVPVFHAPKLLHGSVGVSFARLGLLVFVVIVHLLIPEKCLQGLLAYDLDFLLEYAHLIAISPEEILCSDVLIRIFDPLFQRWHMAPVLPMLIP